MKKKLIASVFSLLVATTAFSKQGASGPEMLDFLKNMKQVPGTGLLMLEKEGKVYLTSRNGRYSISDFTMVDQWSGKTIHSIEDLKLSHRIPMDRLKEQTAVLPIMKHGKGLQTVHIFVDPSDKNSKNIVKAIVNDNEGSPEYTYNFIIYSVIPESADKSISLACTGKKAAFNAFITGDYSDVPKGARCKRASYGVPLALTLGGILGVDAIPFTIAPNGAILKGYEKNRFNKFLERNK